MPTINYDGRLFRVASTSEAGEAGEDTLFRYRQRGSDVWATYEGGAVRMGTLVGTVAPDGGLDVRYAHVGTDGALRSGACRSTPERLPDGRLRLHERWRWTGGEAGTSVVEEVAPPTALDSV